MWSHWCSFHRALPLSTCCVRMGRYCFGVHACTPVRSTGAATLRAPPTLCGALFPRASRPTSARCHCGRAPWPCSAVEATWLIRPITSRLLRVARLRLLTPDCCSCCVLLTKCLAVSGHHSTSSASAEFGGVFPACSWQVLVSRPRAPGSQRPRVASRKHSRCKALVQKGLVVSLVGARCRLVSNLSSRFASVLLLSTPSFSCHTALLTMPAAPGYSSKATSCWQSWDGGAPRLTPPAALACAGV